MPLPDPFQYSRPWITVTCSTSQWHSTAFLVRIKLWTLEGWQSNVQSQLKLEGLKAANELQQEACTIRRISLGKSVSRQWKRMHCPGWIIVLCEELFECTIVNLKTKEVKKEVQKLKKLKILIPVGIGIGFTSSCNHCWHFLIVLSW